MILEEQQQQIEQQLADIEQEDNYLQLNKWMKNLLMTINGRHRAPGL